MPRKLIVMRHAKSSWNNPELADHDRPLNERGKRDSPKIAEEISRRNWTPDLILLSSSTRTRQTLDGMSNRFDGIISEIRPGIYHGTVRGLLAELDDMVDDGTTMILGHHPGSELLIQHLSGQWHTMPTASAALLVESNGIWEVDDVLRPKEI